MMHLAQHHFLENLEKNKVMVKESMQGKESMRDREKVFYFCFEPKQLKKTQRPEHYNHDGPRTELFEKISHNGNCWLIIWGFSSHPYNFLSFMSMDSTKWTSDEKIRWYICMQNVI